MINKWFGAQSSYQRVITLPYINNFCLISIDMRANNRLLNEIHSHINSIGMSQKSSKVIFTSQMQAYSGGFLHQTQSSPLQSSKGGN